jgi:hypothetical protein
MQDATLDGIPGQGYVFPSDDTGSGFRGVFFVDRELAPEGALEAETARFEGTVYRKTTKGKDAVTVSVKEVTNIRSGTRLDFEVVAS